MHLQLDIPCLGVPVRIFKQTQNDFYSDYINRHGILSLGRDWSGRREGIRCDHLGLARTYALLPPSTHRHTTHILSHTLARVTVIERHINHTHLLFNCCVLCIKTHLTSATLTFMAYTYPSQSYSHRHTHTQLYTNSDTLLEIMPYVPFCTVTCHHMHKKFPHDSSQSPTYIKAQIHNNGAQLSAPSRIILPVVFGYLPAGETA